MWGEGRPARDGLQHLQTHLRESSALWTLLTLSCLHSCLLLLSLQCADFGFRCTNACRFPMFPQPVPLQTESEMAAKTQRCAQLMLERPEGPKLVRHFSWPGAIGDSASSLTQMAGSCHLGTQKRVPVAKMGSRREA